MSWLHPFCTLPSIMHTDRYLGTLIDPPETSLPQAEQPQLSQLSPTEEMLQLIHHHLCGPLLNSLHVSHVLSRPELDEALQG